MRLDRLSKIIVLLAVVECGGMVAHGVWRWSHSYEADRVFCQLGTRE